MPKFKTTILQVFFPTEWIGGTDAAECVTTHQLFHKGIQRFIIIGVAVDVGRDHGHVDQVIGVGKRSEHGGHLMDEPRHVVPMSPEGTPVDAIRRLVGGIFDIAQVQHRVEIVCEGLYAETIGGKVLRLIKRDLEAFRCQLFCHMPGNALLRREAAQHLQQETRGLLWIQRQGVLLVLH